MYACYMYKIFPDVVIVIVILVVAVAVHYGHENNLIIDLITRIVL